jgi:hypothetical protein
MQPLDESVVLELAERAAARDPDGCCAETVVDASTIGPAGTVGAAIRASVVVMVPMMLLHLVLKH